MAGNNEFLITNIVDANAFSELERLNKGFDSAKTSYMSFVKEIAKGSSASPKTFEELTAKANGFTASLVKLNGASERMNSIQQEQAAILKKVSAQLGNASGLSKLDALMGRFTKSVEAASEALGRLSSRASEAKDAQIQSAQGAQQSAQAMTQATQALGAQAKSYDELAAEIDRLLGTRRQNVQRMIEEQNAIRSINKEIRDLTKYQGQSSTLSAAQQKRLVELNSSLLQHKAALGEVRQNLNNSSKLFNSAATSMNGMSQSLGRMRMAYRELTEEERNSSFGKQLLASIQQTDAKIKQLDATIGNYQRNVGNYKSHWDGLGMSIQQIGRELPSLAMGWNTFFLAISNNLPMLTDELARAKREYKELTAQGQKATPVWKQVLGSVLSWQTALVVGITVLSMYGKEIMEWVANVFKAGKRTSELDEAMKRLNSTVSEVKGNISDELRNLELLSGRLEAARKGTSEWQAIRDRIVSDYSKYLPSLGEEIDKTGTLASSYDQLAASINRVSAVRGYNKAKEEEDNRYFEIRNKNIEKAYDAFIKEYGEEEGLKQYDQWLKYLDSEEELSMKVQGKLAETSAGFFATANSLLFEIRVQREAREQSLKRFQEIFDLSEEDLIYDPSESQKKAEEAKRKAEEAADNYAAYMKNVRESLNESTLSLMNEGRGKEIAQINADYKEKMDAITGNTREEIALRKNLEAGKQKEIQAVNEKYDKELLEQMDERMKADLQNRLASLRGANEKELDQRLRLQLELNGMMRDAELAEAEKSGADASAIIDKYEKEKNDIVMGNLRERMGIIRSYSDMAEREQEADALKEKSVLERQYRDGEMSRTEYERRMYEIGLSYSKARLQTLINEARQQLALANLPESKRKELEQRISGLQAQLSALGDKEWVDTRGLEGFNDALREMEGTARESLGDTADLFSPFYTVFSGITEAAKRMGKNINEIDFKDFWNNLDPSERAGLILSGFSQIASGITSVMSDIFSGRIDKLEEEQEANEEAYEAELERIESLQESGAISTEEAEARKRAAEDKTKAKEEQIAKKKQELETKQARWDKANSIIQAGIATALAVTKALPDLVLAALVGAMGAAQIAVIASKQIPKYARGTDDHPGGLAIVGDGGRREGVVTGKGLFVTPDKPTLVDLPRHAQVIPDLSGIVSADGLRSDFGLLERQMREKREAGVVVNVDNHFAPLERRMDENTRQLRDIRKLMKAKGRRNDYNWIASRV